jgi:sigma-B regulation protein RsbU (phosphoserine phosphatase)
MPSVSIEVLRSLPFLQSAGSDVLEGLARAAVERNFLPGQVIIKEGSTGRELYVVVTGMVEVVKGSGASAMVLGRRGTGEFFGEMGLLEAKPRFATVRASQPTRLLEFSEPDLHSVLMEQPLLLYQTVRVLMARLREADLTMITDLQSKNVELAEAYRGLKEAQSALVEKEKLDRELELARELQQSILPTEFPTVPRLSFAARSRPARQVGGDFYDVISLRQGRVGLVMADVSDKGMPAALYMALTRSLLHAEAKRSPSPRQVLLSVHQLLLEMSHANMFVTAFYAVLEPASGTLRYACAGQDHPVLVHPRGGECLPLAAKGMLLGCFEQVQLEEASVGLQPGDVLVLYTDGITDANSPAGEFFGTQRLHKTLCGIGDADAATVCDRVFAEVENFQAGALQFDDMALLVVKVA